jgi:hypothetical protein
MHGVIIVMIIMSAVAVFNLRIKRKTVKANSYLWLFGILAIFITYTIHLAKSSPEEAVHFIQYGILAILIYRALTHRISDNGIYIASALIAIAIGIIDEAIQWLTPDRYWGLNDIWLNTFAASLTLLALAMGLKPGIISGPPTRATGQIICRSAIVAILLLSASLLNTPQRISWYTSKIPILDFIMKNHGVMAEYGHYYYDSEIGAFRSRLAPDKLKQTDNSRSVEVAATLDLFPKRSDYREFLRHYTPFNDAFIHEARVHLHRRDYYMQTAIKFKDSDINEFQRRMTIAYYENRIMEKYFPQTLSLSSFALPPESISIMKENSALSASYDSHVSRNLLTHISEKQVLWASIILVIVILTIDRRLSARPQL